MGESTAKSEKQISRREMLGAAGVATLAGLAAPNVASASDGTPTRKDIAKVSFEIANYKESADGFERQTNKNGTIDSSSTDSTYPTSKSVYDFVKGKEAYQHDVTDAGKSLFVGDDGNTVLTTYTVDSEIKGDSSNPVQGDVLYKAINELNDAFNLDEVPQKHEKTGDEVSDSIKYICKSGGYYKAYSSTTQCPSDLTSCEQEYNYSYTSSGVVTSDKQNWALQRVDDMYLALCKDEVGGFFSANKSDLSSWQPPQAIWHS